MTRIPFILLSTADGSPITGAAPTVTISKDGGAFASATNSPVEISGGYYYVDDQIVKGAKLVKVGSDYYYVMSNGKVYVGTIIITAANSNGLVPNGRYQFGQDGKMNSLSGIIDGYYYVDNQIVKGAKLVKVGDDYYYIKTNGKVYVGTIIITEANSNGLLPKGTYVFGEDGKMIQN